MRAKNASWNQPTTSASGGSMIRLVSFSHAIMPSSLSSLLLVPPSTSIKDPVYQPYSSASSGVNRGKVTSFRVDLCEYLAAQPGLGGNETCLLVEFNKMRSGGYGRRKSDDGEEWEEEGDCVFLSMLFPLASNNHDLSRHRSTPALHADLQRLKEAVAAENWVQNGRFLLRV
ncbi:hypothetical protein GG344DRAFT_65184 [Lentinula edodes]|nr:hypothetical protein GG344DRAFT_65184 [Lentinula edodes]